ncbi:MAG: hypothetical protein M3Q07_12750 [Pseudobdellovibrionaceae bacterium]|nr:hypothetical protein [Pseudobdellovibrionaceae bacterium]
MLAYLLNIALSILCYTYEQSAKSLSLDRRHVHDSDVSQDTADPVFKLANQEIKSDRNSQRKNSSDSRRNRDAAGKPVIKLAVKRFHLNASLSGPQLHGLPTEYVYIVIRDLTGSNDETPGVCEGNFPNFVVALG